MRCRARLELGGGENNNYVNPKPPKSYLFFDRAQGYPTQMVHTHSQQSVTILFTIMLLTCKS